MSQSIPEKLSERFSTDSLPERERLDVWREFYAAKVLKLDWEPRIRTGFHANLIIKCLDDVTLYEAAYSPATVKLREIGLEDNNMVTFFLPTKGYRIQQADRRVALRGGDATLLSNSERTEVDSIASGRHFGVVLKSSRIAARIGDLRECFVRRVDRDAVALRLLNAYVRSAIETPAFAFGAQLEQAASAHICDLIALALGQKGEAKRAEPRCVSPAARLAAIKQDVLARLTESGLSSADLSRMHGLSERYIRELFQREETSFSEFLRHARLDRALQALRDPRNKACKVSEIAYNAGFGDLSNFNHEFRRRFGGTPSEIRIGAAMVGRSMRPEKP